DRSGPPPPARAGQGPVPPAPPGTVTPGAVPGGAKRYGLEFLDVLEAIRRGEGPQALRYYEALAEKRERQGVRLEAAKAHSAVAFAASRLGAYQKAIRSGLRALELFRQGPPSEEILKRQLSVYSHLGTSYLHGGDRQEARRFLREGLDLTKTSSNPQRIAFYSGVFSSTLARATTLDGDSGGAVRHGEDAVGSLERYLGNLPPGPRFDKLRMNATRMLALTLARLANAHRLLGNLAEAEASAQRAVPAAKAAGQPEAEVVAFVALGWIASGRKDYAQSLAHFEEAEAVAARAQIPAWNIYAGIGWSQAGQGRHAEALAAFQRAVDAVEDVRAELQETQLRSGFLEDKQGIYHGAVRSALALGKPAEAFRYAERARARAFLDLLGNQTVLSKGKTRALVDEEVRLRAQLSAAQALAQEAGGEDEESGELPAARQQVDAAQRAYRAFLERVRRESVEQASLMAVEPVTLQDVQGLLPEQTTLLEYLVTPSETILWVIDAQRVEVVRIPVARRDLVAQVRAFRRSVAEMASLDVVKDHARALYDRLLAPARPHLRGDRILVVPHDALHYLPFAALRMPEGRWVIEDYAVATLPSASVLKYLRGKGQGANAGALAVGNPDLGPALALRYAEREARAVGTHYPGATVLVRQAATEPRVKALSGSAGVLHFATHAELNEKDPLASALLLVPEVPDDGRLEVRKIFGLDLHARLVVLSACETGLGQLSRGDELVGLQRAFLYAGTPAVVTTLWKVDDRASYRLMEAFYDALAAGGPAAALRQAQRATMAEFPHPFAWAAFGLTGVPR
ncbi:MAG TPA: CHAT domain-containing tetratricopeptide repeat protein, partial [Candidatus Methylomirabilis sp.]